MPTIDRSACSILIITLRVCREGTSFTIIVFARWMANSESENVHFESKPLVPLKGQQGYFFYPNGLGNEMADNLRRSIRRLVKQNRKLVSKHKVIKEELEEKCRHIFALKTLIRQLEAIEKEIFNGKEVDLLTKEKYSEGIIHTCCKSYECQHARKFLRAVRYLGRGPRFTENCQRIIIAANNKFIRHAVRDWVEAVNGHNFNTFLPFWI